MSIDIPTGHGPEDCPFLFVFCCQLYRDMARLCVVVNNVTFLLYLHFVCACVLPVL